MKSWLKSLLKMLGEYALQAAGEELKKKATKTK